MNFLGHFVYLTIIAIVLLCWWFDHRGKAGIQSDLSDARNTINRLRGRN